jgi:hypothetical protein
MRGLKTLAAIGLGIALSVSAAPATAQGAAYRHYVACGLSQKAKPSHLCQKPRKKGAFFRSNRGHPCRDPKGNPIRCVYYTVCVKFPTKKNLCAPRQQAKKGTLYVNKITTNIPGRHRVTWFVEGKRVGLFDFFVPQRSNQRNQRRGK